MLLTKQERVMIWNALRFSNRTYGRRGNVDGAAAVQMVMNRTEGLLIPKVRKYSEKEVAEMIDGIVKSAAKASEDITRHVACQEFNKGYRKGRSERTIEELIEEELAELLRPFVRPRHAEEVIDGEQASEGTEGHHEAPKEDEGK